MKRMFISGLLILTVLSLLACGNSEQAGFDQGTGGITATAIWPGSSPSPKAGVVMRKAPGEVVWVRMIVSKGATTFSADFDVTLGSGSIANVPAGTGWTLTFQGLDAAKNVIYYQGSKSNITVTGGATTNAGSVAMYVVSGMSGKLDTSFGTLATGIVYSTTFPAASNLHMLESVAVQPDGKIIVAGNMGPDTAVARYNTNGTVDTGFATSGVASLPTNSLGRAMSVLIQPDGKIVTGGFSNVGTVSQFTLVRGEASGPDGGFGTGGIVYSRVGTTEGSGARAIALLPTGDIVAAGWYASGSGNNNIALGFFSGVNGSLISTVTTSVFFCPTCGSDAQAVAVQPDGKIVVGGWASNASQTTFAVVRYNATDLTNIVLDTTFNGTGKATTTYTVAGGNLCRGQAMGIQPDGKIVLGGLCMDNTASGQTYFSLARFNANGSVDTTFNSNVDGIVVTPVGICGDTIEDLRILPDGKIIVAGTTTSGSCPTPTYSWSVARYNTNGLLDTSFNASGGQPGVQSFQVRANEPQYAKGVAIQPDGKIIIAGYTDTCAGAGCNRYALARLWNDVTTTNKAYVVNSQSIDNNVSIIDTSSATVSSTKVGGIISRGTTTPRGSTSAAISPKENKLYVVNQQANAVSVVDTINNREIATIPVGSQPLGIAIDPAGNRLYVTNSGSNSVSVIDLSDNSLVTNITVGSTPRSGIAVDPSRNRLYVANSGANSVSVIETITNTVLGSPIAVGLDPRGIGLDTSLNKLFVANNNNGNGNTVSVIDLNSLTVTGTITVGTGPARVAVNPATSRAYVTNNGTNNVSLINTNTNAKITDINVGTFPVTPAVFYSAKHNVTFLYVTNLNDNTVSVIDVTNDTIVPWNPITLPVGSGPNGMAIAP